MKRVTDFELDKVKEEKRKLAEILLLMDIEPRWLEDRFYSIGLCVDLDRFIFVLESEFDDDVRVILGDKFSSAVMKLAMLVSVVKSIQEAIRKVVDKEPLIYIKGDEYKPSFLFPISGEGMVDLGTTLDEVLENLPSLIHKLETEEKEAQDEPHPVGD